MKIEVGKHYRTKWGDEAVVTHISRGELFCAKGYIILIRKDSLMGEVPSSWTLSGISKSIHYGEDLEDEWGSPENQRSTS